MKTSISNILFTTDLSRNSTFALHHAVTLAQSTGARVHVLHAAEPMSDDARITMKLFFQDDAAREKALQTRVQYIRDELDERQDTFWKTVPEELQAVRQQIDSIDVIEGHPAEVILRRSRELDCDLIVLGAHSHGFSQTFLGSIAKRVLRRAVIPTLVVPYRAD